MPLTSCLQPHSDAPMGGHAARIDNLNRNNASLPRASD